MYIRILILSNLFCFKAETSKVTGTCILVIAGNYSFFFFRIFFWMPNLLSFAADLCCLYTSLQIHVFLCNFTKYLYYRRHLKMKIDSGLEREKIRHVSYNDFERWLLSVI